ncbi:LPD1 domain-containing protein [Pseudovibrio ascidiaceicola]|uniref:LPD1 domain-containing protein n=1 Tax=Pseudovibrio ascidiaceicola TaxID=285279 RepID=UPI003D36E240
MAPAFSVSEVGTYVKILNKLAEQSSRIKTYHEFLDLRQRLFEDGVMPDELLVLRRDYKRIRDKSLAYAESHYSYYKRVSNSCPLYWANIRQDVERLVSRGFPQEYPEHRNKYFFFKDSTEQFRVYLAKGKYGELVGQEDSLEKAWAFAEQHDQGLAAEKKAEPARSKKKDALIGTAIDKICPRIGPKRRNGNITQKQLMETFEFGGFEWGNWVSTDAERQEYLNHFYDSFCDMAEVLNVPHKDMGLFSDIVISVGARGFGRTTMAHWSSSQRLMHYTRTTGAGSVAHEWFHGLDALSGAAIFEAAPNKSGIADTFLTPGEWGAEGDAAHGTKLDKYHAPLGPAMDKVLSAIRHRVVSRDSRLSEVRAKYDELRSDYEERVGVYNQEMSSYNAQFKAWREAGRPEEKRKFLKDWSATLIPVSADLEDLRKQVNALGKQKSALTFSSSGQVLMPSELLERLVDYKAYFSKNIELMARSFETYVHDKLAEKGIKNDFLVSFVGDEVYPQGEQRVKVNEAFDDAMNMALVTLREHRRNFDKTRENDSSSLEM